MTISTSIFSRVGICSGFMVMRLWAPTDGGPEQHRFM
jgi:hypothetical protein